MLTLVLHYDHDTSVPNLSYVAGAPEEGAILAGRAASSKAAILAGRASFDDCEALVRAVHSDRSDRCHPPRSPLPHLHLLHLLLLPALAGWPALRPNSYSTVGALVNLNGALVDQIIIIK